MSPLIARVTLSTLLLRTLFENSPTDNRDSNVFEEDST
jgi:hypothetical protein